MVKITVLMVLISNMLFASVAIVKQTTGTVEVKRAKQVIPIIQGSHLENGDIILTKSKSSIGFILEDGSVLSLGENSIFRVTNFVFKPSEKKYNIDLKLEKGKAVFSSGKVGKLAPESVKFRIPEGMIGIRGTKFAVEVK